MTINSPGQNAYIRFNRQYRSRLCHDECIHVVTSRLASPRLSFVWIPTSIPIRVHKMASLFIGFYLQFFKRFPCNTCHSAL